MARFRMDDGTVNEYAAQFGRLYTKTPKVVFAAIAYSLALRLNDDMPGAAIAAFLSEWNILHENGIVPQKSLSSKH